MNVVISRGNSKMGSISSVSLPPDLTCRKDCTCKKKCYARKIERIRKNVRESYIKNYTILTEHPEQFWREVEASIMTSRFFRFHVAGDIPDTEYFVHMIDISRKNPHCEILCFTKKYDIINTFIKKYGRGIIPGNLHIVLSAWPGMEMDNPYRLPEAHVRFKDGKTTADANAIPCQGNCSECAITDKGCWVLKDGEQVIFDEH